MCASGYNTYAYDWQQQWTTQTDINTSFRIGINNDKDTGMAIRYPKLYLNNKDTGGQFPSRRGEGRAL
jgi:hypothetical protein